jgi:large subunit ribosomal protein L10
VPSVQIIETKKQQVDEIADIFANSGVYLFDYRGLTVKQMNELRERIKSLDANMKVIKNRLVIKYFEREKKTEYGRDLFQGPMAVAYVGEKFVEVAKVLVDYEKENDKVEIKAGFIEKTFADKEKIKYVAKLPGKEQLMAQLVGAFSMPLKKMGMALSAPLRNMLILLNNLKDKKEKEEKNNG